MKLRDYQIEIKNKIDNVETCRWLVQLPTGCGKTVTFANLKFNRMLIISHREELVFQPKRYFDCTYGIEMGKYKSNGEKVISTCVASLVRRLENFSTDEFDVIVIDEAHHSAAKSYRKIIDYFKPQKLLGFTATPNRNDNVKLSDIYDNIAYKMSLLTAIKQGYLTDIRCTRAYLSYDLSNVRKSKNDFNVEDLEEAMIDTAIGIADVYDKHAIGQTLIFGVSVEHCMSIRAEIPGSVVVHAGTKNRAKIIEDFTNRKFRCLINCMIFTEGTDLPLVETIIIARPTKNESLYSQMVGRGLRLHPGKLKLNLIDCVGVSNNLNLCTAPSLLGIKYNDEHVEKETIETESLFDLPEVIEQKMDKPSYWKINYKQVDLWAKGNGYNLHDVDWYQLPNGDFSLNLPKMKPIIIKCPDELGKSNDGREAQEIFDSCYQWLETNHSDKRYIWDMNIKKKWGRKPATQKQIDLVQSMTGEYNPNLTKLEASQIMNRIFSKRRK